MTNQRGHPPHLPVLALDQFQTNPTVPNVFAETNRWIPRRDHRLWFQKPGPAWQGPPSLYDDAFLQLPQRFRGRNSFNLRPVNPPMAVSRVQQSFVELRLVAQQQQAFAVGIEPADGINVLWKPESGQRSTIRSVRRELRNHTARFVECDQHRAVSLPCGRISHRPSLARDTRALQLLCNNGFPRAGGVSSTETCRCHPDPGDILERRPEQSAYRCSPAATSDSATSIRNGSNGIGWS